jgi:hypothetical protein
VKGKSAAAIALTRQMMYRNGVKPHPVEAHKVESLAVFYTSLADGKEGVAAFLEKRAAQFKSPASALPPFAKEWLGS